MNYYFYFICGDDQNQNDLWWVSSLPTMAQGAKSVINTTDSSHAFLWQTGSSSSQKWLPQANFGAMNLWCWYLISNSDMTKFQEDLGIFLLYYIYPNNWEKVGRRDEASFGMDFNDNIYISTNSIFHLALYNLVIWSSTLLCLVNVFIIEINQHLSSTHPFLWTIYFITIGACDLSTAHIPIAIPIPRATHIQSYIILFEKRQQHVRFRRQW